jgi:hypothetical protein
VGEEEEDDEEEDETAAAAECAPPAPEEGSDDDIQGRKRGAGPGEGEAQGGSKMRDDQEGEEESQLACRLSRKRIAEAGGRALPQLRALSLKVPETRGPRRIKGSPRAQGAFEPRRERGDLPRKRP